MPKKTFWFALIILPLLAFVWMGQGLAQTPFPLVRTLPQPVAIPGPAAKNKDKGIPALKASEFFLKFYQIGQCLKVPDPAGQEHQVCLTKATPYSAAATYDGKTVDFGWLFNIFKFTKKVGDARLTVYSNGAKIGWKIK